jgi:hypothetical protein
MESKRAAKATHSHLAHCRHLADHLGRRHYTQLLSNLSRNFLQLGKMNMKKNKRTTTRRR